MLGDRPIDVDVLYETDRAQRLVDTFRDAVAGTAYDDEQWIMTNDPLPRGAIEQCAEAACLCQPPHLHAERDAVYEALFGIDPEDADAGDHEDDDAIRLAENVGVVARDVGVEQCRRSVAHYLTLIETDYEVAQAESAYRYRLWEPPQPRCSQHAEVSGQLAAVVAKFAAVFE